MTSSSEHVFVSYWIAEQLIESSRRLASHTYACLAEAALHLVSKEYKFSSDQSNMNNIFCYVVLNLLTLLLGIFLKASWFGKGSRLCHQGKRNISAILSSSSWYGFIVITYYMPLIVFVSSSSTQCDNQPEYPGAWRLLLQSQAFHAITKCVIDAGTASVFISGESANPLPCESAPSFQMNVFESSFTCLMTIWVPHMYIHLWECNFSMTSSNLTYVG